MIEPDEPWPRSIAASFRDDPKTLEDLIADLARAERESKRAEQELSATRKRRDECRELEQRALDAIAARFAEMKAAVPCSGPEYWIVERLAQLDSDEWSEVRFIDEPRRYQPNRAEAERVAARTGGPDWKGSRFIRVRQAFEIEAPSAARDRRLRGEW